MGEHASRLNETDSRIFNIEEELYQAQGTEQAKDKTIQYILNKLEDLENRFRRSNLYFIGVPKYMQSSAIAEIFTWRIPEALVLPGPCKVEHAHCIGVFSTERTSPPSDYC